MSRIDANSGYAAMAVTDDASLTPTPLLVDPVTGRLEITIYISSAAAYGGVIKLDENSEEVATAVTDDASATVSPLLTDTNGYLWADVVVE